MLSIFHLIKSKIVSEEIHEVLKKKLGVKLLSNILWKLRNKPFSLLRSYGKVSVVAPIICEIFLKFLNHFFVKFLIWGVSS